MFLQNRNNFIEKIKLNTAAIFYSGKSISKSNDQFFPFEVNRNFYYLTGINQENVILLILKTVSCNQFFLFLEKSDPNKALWDGDILSFSDVAQISQIPLSNIKPIETFSHFVFGIVNSLGNSLNGFYLDLAKITEEQENNWALNYSHKIMSLYPFVKIYNSFPFLSSLRQVKNIYEQDQINKALDIHCRALNDLLIKIQPGMHEYHISAWFHYFLEISKTQKAFEIIAASGKNALILHYNQNNSQLQNNELLLFDAGVNYQHYSSDITRCYPVGGRFTSLQKDIYNVVLKANKEIIAWVRPHHTFSQLNHYGKTILSQGLKKLSIFKEKDNISQYCYHGLGHHLGLDIHDVGNYNDVIGENSVITVEPGLYFKDFNIGVRIEDNLLITKDGAVNLSQNIPKEIEEIETLMSSFIMK